MAASRWVLAVLATALAACGGGADEPAAGDAVVLEEQITDAARHVGVVLSSSVGDEPFCRGGRTSGGSEGPVITQTFHCDDGTLTVRFAPTQVSLEQSAPWEVVGGTGRWEGVRAGGTMQVRFDEADPGVGRATFTGQVR